MSFFVVLRFHFFKRWNLRSRISLTKLSRKGAYGQDQRKIKVLTSIKNRNGMDVLFVVDGFLSKRSG